MFSINSINSSRRSLLSKDELGELGEPLFPSVSISEVELVIGAHVVQMNVP